MVTEKPNTYCAFVKGLEASNVHRTYHDTQYGFPIDSDNELFGRLILEINQAGLNWTTILKKQEHFRNAYSAFDITNIATYTEKDRERLLLNPGIIRNKLKVNAAIFNAQKIIHIQEECGSFHAWLDNNHPLSLEEWVALFKKTFTFTGGEITKEFLISTGYLKGAHEKKCPIYANVMHQKPMWDKIMH